MTVETVNFFLAFLAVGGLVLLVFVVGCWLVGRSGSGLGARATLTSVAPFSLAFAALVAVVATSGSLYYSEVAGFDPCRLCWIQRYFMYPSAVLLLLSLRFPRLRVVPLILATCGFGVSIYHRLEQQFPDDIGGSCALDNPCSGRWVDTFGLITIPTMAAVAFALVVVFVLVSFGYQKQPGGHE